MYPCHRTLRQPKDNKPNIEFLRSNVLTRGNDPELYDKVVKLYKELGKQKLVAEITGRSVKIVRRILRMRGVYIKGRRS